MEKWMSALYIKFPTKYKESCITHGCGSLNFDTSSRQLTAPRNFLVIRRGHSYTGWILEDSTGSGEYQTDEWWLEVIPPPSILYVSVVCSPFEPFLGVVRSSFLGVTRSSLLGVMRFSSPSFELLPTLESSELLGFPWNAHDRKHIIIKIKRDDW